MSKKAKGPNEISPEMKAAINAAVIEGIAAGRKLVEQEQKEQFNPYKATEERLEAMPALFARIADNREHLQSLEDYPHLPRRSADICRFRKGGVRVSEEDIVDTLKIDLKAKIAADDYEIETMNTALKLVEEDPYYPALTGKYFRGEDDQKLAESLAKDESTVRKGRNKLVRRVMVRLYGVEAVKR